MLVNTKLDKLGTPVISCMKLAKPSTLQNLTSPLQTLSKAYTSGRHLEPTQ